MFELKVREEEKDGFIYKIMQMDLGDKKEEIYIKLPISEKEYLTDMYDPYVVFNIFKMMSIGGDCYIRGKVSKSLLDNLEMFVNCWKIWLPDKCKDIKIIADEEIDEPVKLNNDAIMCFSGGLDSVTTLYRHYKGVSGRNNRNIKKLLAITGARDLSSRRGYSDKSYQEFYNKKMNRMESISSDLGFNVVHVLTNLTDTDTIFEWGDEFIALFVSIMMLYQDNYNNLIMASDEFVGQDSIVVPHGSNPISNNFLQSNKFKLITDGQFMTRLDKLETIKDWDFALKNMLACDECYTETNKLCGKCYKCLVTKLNYKALNYNIDFNEIYDDPSFNLEEYDWICEYANIFYKEVLYYDKIHHTVPKEIVVRLTEILNKYTTIININNNVNKKYEEFINKISWWIPVKKLREKFRNKFKE
ncbi:hypothetical protein WESB_1424 [Brachyspira pilosicoli WesB]|uniref:Uncharacterized protein n=1 Tax=Brachyspira pilosicoli WesB TaxID=1161918 RepID=K0JJ49_BRAPL|nr:hypothetical protein [Brachyspira pilosicoli]CCG56892.1 hypothetical protein WESB_1424 [Brachyspira pilosicoli WesB]